MCNLTKRACESDWPFRKTVFPELLKFKMLIPYSQVINFVFGYLREQSHTTLINSLPIFYLELTWDFLSIFNSATFSVLGLE